MRSKIIALAACLLFLCVPSFWPTRAQEGGPRQLIVPLAEGGFVAFKAETVAPDGKGPGRASAEQRQGVFDSQALIDQIENHNQIIHRVLVDAEGTPVFGYDLQVSPLPTQKRFKVTAMPIGPAFALKLLARRSSGSQALPAALRISSLPQTSESQLLDDGDGFTLDLLVNAETGIRIVDVVKLSFDRATLWDFNPKALPRDFTLDAVLLSVKQYQLLINGKVVATGKPASECSGTLLWLYIPDHGRFIFSLLPRDGYQFQKVGMVDDNRIEFTLNRDHFEWISKEPVLPGGGAWNLWVLHDPKYSPLTFEAQNQDEPKKKNKLDQLDDAVNKVKDQSAKMRDQKQSTFHGVSAAQQEKEPTSRPRVMIGSADRIENLWPKN